MVPLFRRAVASRIGYFLILACCIEFPSWSCANFLTLRTQKIIEHYFVFPRGRHWLNACGGIVRGNLSAVSEQIGLSRDREFHSLRRCSVPSDISIAHPR